MDQSLVVRLNQAAINGIRAAGATTQWINVEGNSWTGAWTWVSKSQNGATMANLKDPSDKIMCS
jgi:endoglucanase